MSEVLNFTSTFTSHFLIIKLLIFLGDNNGDWACDCRPAYIYYPQTLRCYEAYTQGPCKQNEILKLPQGKFVPVCERNTCNVGQIRYENVCGKLGGYEACKQPSKGAKSFLLKVNPTTLQLNCTLPNFGSRIEINEEEGLYESDHCFIGGKRAQENTCVIHTWTDFYEKQILLTLGWKSLWSINSTFITFIWVFPFPLPRLLPQDRENRRRHRGLCGTSSWHFLKKHWTSIRGTRANWWTDRTRLRLGWA